MSCWVSTQSTAYAVVNSLSDCLAAIPCGVTGSEQHRKVPQCAHPQGAQGSAAELTRGKLVIQGQRKQCMS